MATLKLENIDPVVLRIITAYAKTQKRKLEEMIYQRGIEGVLTDAVVNEGVRQVQVGEIQADVLALAAKDWSAVWQGLSASYQKTKSYPESIALGLEAQAANLPEVVA
jgi:hypothetical protein